MKGKWKKKRAKLGKIWKIGIEDKEIGREK